MSADIPQSVQQVLNVYIALMNDALPGLLTGLYLHGSVALGAYDPGLSDIDFIAITSRRCAPSDRGVCFPAIDHRRLSGEWILNRVDYAFP